jgi:peptide chain release factor 3
VPIITFINKLDREARDPFDLMSEIEQQLALDVTPMTWPIGMGRDFLGSYDIQNDTLLLFDRGEGERVTDVVRVNGLDDPELDRVLPERAVARLREEVEMVKGLCPPFDLDSYRAGHQTPVFFGSAINNFGVRELLHGVGSLAPPPRPQPAIPRDIAPDEAKVAGFVFKVQANMDPQHRDRVAFMRLSSGRFTRGMKLKHVRTGRMMAISAPVMFLARDRNLAEEAFPGDIIGIPNHGALRIGDTLTEGEDLKVMGIPNFAPEILRRARLDDPMKSKHLKKALEQMADEGVTRVFKPLSGADWIVGVVGPLQIEVLAERIGSEYDLKMHFEAAPYETARWLACDDAKRLKQFTEETRSACAEDHDGALVYLVRNAWELNRVIKDWPEIRFQTTREQT